MELECSYMFANLILWTNIKTEKEGKLNYPASVTPENTANDEILVQLQMPPAQSHWSIFTTFRFYIWLNFNHYKSTKRTISSLLEGCSTIVFRRYRFVTAQHHFWMSSCSCASTEIKTMQSFSELSWDSLMGHFTGWPDLPVEDNTSSSVEIN